jgi:hypothetical protein
MYDAGLYDPLEEEDEVCLKISSHSYEAEQTVSFLVYGLWWLMIDFAYSLSCLCGVIEVLKAISCGTLVNMVLAKYFIKKMLAIRERMQCIMLS